MLPDPTVAIIVVSWNTRKLLSECIASVIATCQDIAYEVIVIDNGSTDGSIAMVQQDFPQVRLVLNQQNVGFGQANNQAANLSKADYFLLLNSDARLFAHSMRALLDLVQTNPQIGAVGTRLENADGSFQASYTNFPTLWREFLILSGIGRKVFGPWYPSHGPKEDAIRKVDYVEGAGVLIRREAYQQVGGFNPEFFMYSEEVFLCYALAKNGWQVWYQPRARVLHHGGASSKNRQTKREADLYQGRIRFFLKAYGPLPAHLLAYLIVTITTLKQVFHGVLRIISRGKIGRSVVPIIEIKKKIKEVL
jgi:N-acetylglucosaminyl-diphospho-decaprenol L-rhamnosyltransferase